ncbi:hypothetical protein CN980_03260, partial [Bacillus cereus]
MGRTTFMQILKKAYFEIYKTKEEDTLPLAFLPQEKKYVKKNKNISTSMVSHFRNPSLYLDSPPASSPNIVIVGGGLAGLTCAYRL